MALSFITEIAECEKGYCCGLAGVAVKVKRRYVGFGGNIHANPAFFPPPGIAGGLWPHVQKLNFKESNQSLYLYLARHTFDIAIDGRLFWALLYF